MKAKKGVSRRDFVSGVLSSAAVACLPKGVIPFAGEGFHNLGKQQGGGAHRLHERIEFLAIPFPLEQVRFLDGVFLDAAKTNQKYLMSLPEDRLVHNFRVNAGLPSSAEPLGGWESPNVELRGHLPGIIFRRAH